MKDSRRTISPESVATRAVLVLVISVLGLWLAYELKVLIVDLLMALTLASAIAPLAERGEKRGVPRILTVIAVYVALALIYACVAIFLAPIIWEQAVQLYQHLPRYMSNLMGWYQQLIVMAGEQAEAVRLDLSDVQPGVLKLIRRTLDLTAGLVGLILNGILVLFLTACFVVEAKTIWSALLRWVAPQHREKAASLIVPLETRLGGYVRGQILVSLAVSSFLCVGLSLLQVPYALVLGVLAGLLNLMPFVGSMLTATFSVLVAANHSLTLGALVVGLFAIEQWFESNLIVPHLLGRQVDMHPVIVLFAILIGATIMGLPGALVAVPVASAILLLAEEFYVKPLNSRPEPSP